jgi:hypothetical protein
MANIKAKISTNTNRVIAKTVSVQSGTINLGDLGDIDATAKSDGAMIIYNATTGKYEVKTEIQNENLNIIGGTY